MIEIKISGAGGTLSYPTDIIIKALNKFGFKIEIDFDYTHKDFTEDELYKEKFRLESYNLKPEVRIKTNNIPWGG